MKKDVTVPFVVLHAINEPVGRDAGQGFPFAEYAGYGFTILFYGIH
jgi:hypothetical protein